MREDNRPDRRNNTPFSNSPGLQREEQRIRQDGRSNRRNKTPFSNFSGVVRTLPQGKLLFVIYTTLRIRHSCIVCLYTENSAITRGSSVTRDKSGFSFLYDLFTGETFCPVD